jgi:pheromone shutdown protein TraB
MRETMEEMPFFEKMRFRFGSIRDAFSRKKNADDVIREMAENEEGYMNSIRKRYPTLVRKLIDERDVHMAAKIKEASGRYGNIVAVIGDGHVTGIAKLLEGGTVRKIRLKTLMDPESMNALRAELWTGIPEEEE